MHSGGYSPIQGRTRTRKGTQQFSMDAATKPWIPCPFHGGDVQRRADGLAQILDDSRCRGGPEKLAGVDFGTSRSEIVIVANGIIVLRVGIHNSIAANGENHRIRASFQTPAAHPLQAAGQVFPFSRRNSVECRTSRVVAKQCCSLVHAAIQYFDTGENFGTAICGSLPPRYSRNSDFCRAGVGDTLGTRILQSIWRCLRQVCFGRRKVFWWRCEPNLNRNLAPILGFARFHRCRPFLLFVLVVVDSFLDSRSFLLVVLHDNASDY
mmetsp:Transcript_11152/g.26830  ORF Transcript_11152/g.26830 Transcript_11152/m.26830 type:complete len:266 (+) Transcript_11152:377-1174(+)